MRALKIALALAVVATLASAARPQDTEEWERDVAALAPGQETATTLIVDELTRQPVPGARLTWYAEIEGMRAPALGAAVADAHGLATLDWTELATWDADGHFLVTADGYAAKHEYGTFPPAQIELLRGRDVRARVVDLLGRPVEDADVEVFLGCGHGPILDFVQTDAGGRITVRGQDVEEALLWIEHPGTQADYLELSDGTGLGAGERTLLVAPGGVAEGVVVDSAGRGLEGVEVRSFQCHRGPVALTDRRGRFRLVGVEDEASLYLAHPYAAEGWAILDGEQWRPGVPLRLHLTPWGVATDTQSRFDVEVRVRGADGRPGDFSDLALVRDADGLAYHPTSTDDTPAGGLRFELPPGIYVPTAAYAFASWKIDPSPIAVGRGEPTRISLRAEPRPRLVVAGSIPADAHTHVAIEGAAGSTLDAFLGDDGECVPGEGPVVVTVEWLGRAFFFPAGPEQDGVRTVTIELPRPHLLRIPPDLHGEFELVHDGAECVLESVDDGFVTYAWGDLVLRITDDDSLLRVPVTLPAEPATEIEITLPEQRERRTIRVIPPTGLDDELDVWIVDVDGGGFGLHRGGGSSVEHYIDGPVWVRVERDDYAVWTQRVEGPGDVAVTWGDAGLAFHVLDDGGDHVQTTVLVDGLIVPQRDPDDYSVLRVRGLTPGPHTVLLLPHDDAFLAKEMRVMLAAGETRRKKVELSLR